MSTFEKIVNYGKHFVWRNHDATDQFRECFLEVSKKFHVNQDDVEKIIIHAIHSIILSVFEKAARNGMPLKPYQKLAVRHMAMHRGMICAFDVGTGKTLTAVAVCDALLQIASVFGKSLRVMVITPTSLQENFKKEMIAYGSDPTDARYIFYTITKFGMLYKEKKLDCTDVLFVVDEAHALRTDYRYMFTPFFMTPEPKENTRAESGVKCAFLASKVLLLTATPIYNKTHDIVNLISMVNGVAPPYNVDPLRYVEAQATPEMEEIYGKRILFQEPEDKKLYPERTDVYIRVVMDEEYEEKYEQLEDVAYKRYIERGEEPVLFGMDEEVSNNFLISLRKASNTLTNICLKCNAAMTIIRRGQKTIFYSFFLNTGVNLMKELLNEEHIKYYFISGDVPAKKRVTIVKEFNDPRSGVNLLIITKAGGEGLDLKGVRNVIIFEKGWNVASEEQVIGRAIRYKSHMHLPMEERKVNVYHIILIKPNTHYFLEELKSMEKAGKNNFYSRIMQWKVWNFPKEIIIGKDYLRTSFSMVMLAIDEIMLINMLIKEVQNRELLDGLRKMQITEDSIQDGLT
jgi:superfamily II DNA or RNA helicase